MAIWLYRGRSIDSANLTDPMVVNAMGVGGQTATDIGTHNSAVVTLKTNLAAQETALVAAREETDVADLITAVETVKADETDIGALLDSVIATWETAVTLATAVHASALSAQSREQLHRVEAGQAKALEQIASFRRAVAG